MGERSPSFNMKVPAGDNRPRRVCDECGFVDYVNPKVVVGAVCTWGDKVLLCRRAIEPRRGYWTMPAGFLEEKEATEDGARREAWEEARAELEIEGLLGVYSVARISQVHIIYRARLRSPDVAAGEESLEVRLFAWEEIPWDDLAFPSVHWSLQHYRDSLGQATFAARTNPA
jgi:ADP-ribose pyrophosphatase YjhB (NUDIX family)